MLNFSLKNEIVDSTEDVLHKRASTPVYGTLLISWAVFHWEFLYTAAFDSQEYIYNQTGLLKNDYLIKTFFDVGHLYFYVSWVMPFLITWLVIWKLPDLVLLPAFEKEEENRVKKINTRLRLEKQVVTEETKLVEQTTKKLEAEEKKATRQKKVEQVSPQVLWEKEYKEFQATQHYSTFRWLTEAVYQHGGLTEWYPPHSSSKFGISQSLLAYAHSHELIELGKDENNYQTISFTEKGKFFVGKISQEGKI